MRTRSAAIALLGGLAMLVGALSSSWWTFGNDSGYGLTGANICTFGPCEFTAYPKSSVFTMLGTVAFYGSFVVAAVTLFAVVFQNRLAISTAAIAMVLAVVMLGIAIGFFFEGPTGTDLAIGYSMIAYALGCILAAVGNGMLTRTTRRF
jgi:hypothetical protein